MQHFRIECKDKVQIPGHGWLIEGYVREGIVFPETDVKLLDVTGRKILIATILGFVRDEDLVDFVVEGQYCGVLMRYVDLSALELEGYTLEEL